MKRIAILTALILAAVSAFGQAVRVDIPLQTAGPSVPISGGPLPQALWVANAAAYLCTHPSATLVACQAHPITTYTDSTGGTTCPTATPLVQLPGNTCTAATGTTANVGFWYGGGLFDYWIVSSYGAYGPFSGNSGGTSSGVSQILAGINVTISPTGGTGAVTINATGSGGSSVWGGITGTLSNQTDLQTALNGKQAAGNYLTALTGDCTATGPGAVAITCTKSGGTAFGTGAFATIANYLTIANAASTYAPIFTLTTTGTSGAATYSGNVLNIPQYAAGSGMLWPAGAGGIPNYTGLSTWGTTYSASNQIPANFLNLSSYLTSATAASTYEPLLGNPSTNGYLLSSTSAGVRSWVAPYTLPGTVVQTNQANTYTTGLQDFSSATQVKHPVAAGYVALANGEMGYDSTNLNWHAWDNGADWLVGMMPKTGLTNNHCAEFSLSGNTWTLADAGGTCTTGGSMVWPTTAGIVYWTSGTTWGGAYNSSTPIPANYLPATMVYTGQANSFGAYTQSFAGSIADTAHSSFGANATVDYTNPVISSGLFPSYNVISAYEKSTTATGVNGIVNEVDWSPTVTPTKSPVALASDEEINFDSLSTVPSSVFANYLAVESAGATKGVQEMIGVLAGANADGNAPVFFEVAAQANTGNFGTGTVSTAVSLDTNYLSTSTGTTTNLRYLECETPQISGGGSVTNEVCLQIGTLNGTGTNYPVWVGDTHPSYFAGALIGNGFDVGSATSPVVVIPSTALGYQGSAAGYVQLAPAPSGAGYLYQNGAGTYSWGSPSSSGTVTTSGSPVSPNIAAFSSSTAITAATSANIQTAIGASVYDAYGAAAARQANLNLAPGTYANGDMCTYASSGTLLNCNTAVPGAYTLPSQYKTWSCEPGLGDGLNAITAGTYLQSTCWNKTGATVTLTGVGCFTDNAGSSTLNAAGNTLGALLTGAVTCTSSLASGTQSSNVLLTNGDYIKFTFVADGTSKQTTFVVTGSY